MSASREELLVYGFIKEHHKSNNMELPPNDLILLFVSWISLKDQFDKNEIDENIKVDPEQRLSSDLKENHYFCSSCWYIHY